MCVAFALRLRRLRANSAWHDYTAFMCAFVPAARFRREQAAEQHKWSILRGLNSETAASTLLLFTTLHIARSAAMLEN